MTTINKLKSSLSVGRCCFFVLMCLLIAMLPGTLYAAAAVKIGVLPITAQEPGVSGIPEAGLRGMLVSRLAAEEGLAVLASARVDQVLAAGPGDGWSTDNLVPFFSSLGADYLLSMKVSATDTGWALQAQLFHPFSSGHAAHTFEKSGNADAQLVQAMSGMALEIGLFIQDMEEKGVVKDPPGKPGPAAEIKSEDLVSFRTVHPERSNPDVIALAGAFRIDKPIFESSFSIFLTGMDEGDIDGDGDDDIILAGESYLVVKDFKAGNMTQQAVYPLPAGAAVHGVSSADLNNNGIDEIYVSAMADSRPCSFVLERGPEGFNLLASNLPWYLRVVPIPGEKVILAGQRFDGDDAGAVIQLTWQDQALRKTGNLMLPYRVNLFDFSYADLDGDGANEIVNLSWQGYLQVHNPAGKLLWQGEELLCGTYRALSGKPSDDSLQPLFAPKYELLQVPSRIVVVDFNNDGKADILVNKNPATLAGMFEGGVSYPSGVILGLVWKGDKLREAWRTKEIDGYVVDYQVRRGDRLKTGENMESSTGFQLMVGVRRQTGLLEGRDEKSWLHIFEMDLEWL